MARRKGAKVVQRQMEARHRQFADLYLSDPSRNAVRAYQTTYPKAKVKSTWSSASQLLKHPRVADYIKQREAELAAVAKTTQLEVLEGLRKIKDVGLQELEIQNDKLGGIRYKRLVDANNASRALELLGKTERMFVERVEQETTHKFSFVVKK